MPAWDQKREELTRRKREFTDQLRNSYPYMSDVDDFMASVLGLPMSGSDIAPTHQKPTCILASGASAECQQQTFPEVYCVTALCRLGFLPVASTHNSCSSACRWSAVGHRQTRGRDANRI